jgi:hypothetical protein
MRPSVAIVAGVASAGLAFFAGRASVRPPPTRVEYLDRTTETVVERVKVVEGPVRWRTKRVEIPGPAGPVITEERWIEKGPVTYDATSEAQVVTRTEAVVETERSTWRVAALAGWDSLALEPSVWGGEASRRIAGPFWVGVYATKRVEVGLTLGVEW